MSGRSVPKNRPLQNERYCSWFINDADVNQKDVFLATESWSLILNDTSPEFLARQGTPGIPDSCIFWFYRCYERNIFLKDEDCDKSTIMLHSRFFISMITKLFDIVDCPRRLIHRTLYDISSLFYEKRITVSQFCILSESALQSLGTCLGESFEVGMMTSYARIFSFILKRIISKSKSGVKIIKYCSAINSIIRNVFFSPTSKYNKRSHGNSIDEYIDDNKITKSKPARNSNIGGNLLLDRIRASSSQHTNQSSITTSTTTTVTSRSDPLARLAYSPITSPHKKTARSIIKMSSLDFSFHREIYEQYNTTNNNMETSSTTMTTSTATINSSGGGSSNIKYISNKLKNNRIQTFNYQVVHGEETYRSSSEHCPKKSNLTSSFPTNKAVTVSCNNIVRSFNPNEYEITPNLIGRRNSNSPPNNHKIYHNDMSIKSDFLFPCSSRIAVISEDIIDEEIEDTEDALKCNLYNWEVAGSGKPTKKCHTPPVLQQRYEKYFGEYY